MSSKNKGNTFKSLSDEFQTEFSKSRVILSFNEFLDQVKENPKIYLRTAHEYIMDTIDSFGNGKLPESQLGEKIRYSIFDIGTNKGKKIVGGEQAQNEIIKILNSFKYEGFASKLILLHGPNGSAKSSTVETITHGMEQYSHTPEGAVYRFNWIFPADKQSLPISQGEATTIGFGKVEHNGKEQNQTYAFLEENKIASKLVSEFKENPIFLLPMPFREKLLRQWIAEKEDIAPELVEINEHILSSGLTKKNQQIFENLLNAYKGDIEKVFRHVQIERFYYSRQYRIGISTVEPQLSIDAREKQLTLDKNYSNLPTILHTMSFFQAEGELVEANRGILEFSDLLKRPLESFKYLLSTIEKGAINIPSGTANLDLVFIGTSNEKHLDSFKTIPDFSSFKGRIELVTVPYLLNPIKEMDIYADDIESIEKTKKVCPHTLEILCYWAVMTRLKQPDPEQYDEKHRSLIKRLDPLAKISLYLGEQIRPKYNQDENITLKELREKIWKESQRMVVYEGRFGASPREIKAILHRAAQSHTDKTVTPINIFEELEHIIKDRTIYEFLQFEPRGFYHDVGKFIHLLKKKFIAEFEQEIVNSMSMADEQEYESLLVRYVDHVVAEIKKEKIWDPTTKSYNLPSQSIMENVENILAIKKSKEDHRNSMLSRIASKKIEVPDAAINVSEVFTDYLESIKQHFYQKHREEIEKIYNVMLAFPKGETNSFSQKQIETANETYKSLEEKYGYDFDSAYRCLQFLVKEQKS